MHMRLAQPSKTNNIHAIVKWCWLERPARDMHATFLLIAVMLSIAQPDAKKQAPCCTCDPTLTTLSQKLEQEAKKLTNYPTIHQRCSGLRITGVNRLTWMTRPNADMQRYPAYTAQPGYQ